MGGSLCSGRGSPGLVASATTWRLAVCSSNRLFLSAVCALQPRVQWQVPTAERLLEQLAVQPIRSMVLIAAEDGLEGGLQDLLPSIRQQVAPAQVQLVLFLEDHLDPRRLQGWLDLGALVICRLQLFHGALLAQAINTALLNRPWLDPLFAELHQSRHRKRYGVAPRHGGELPARERELLQQVGQGYNAVEISQRLGIRCDTVRRTLSRAYRRIGVRDRAQAVGWCLCHGLISRQELERRYRHQVEQGSPMEES